MFVTTFKFDAKTDKVLEDLMQHYGTVSKAAVLRKAIALLNVAKRYEQLDGSVVLRRDGQDVKVIMR